MIDQSSSGEAELDGLASPDPLPHHTASHSFEADDVKVNAGRRLPVKVDLKLVTTNRQQADGARGCAIRRSTPHARISLADETSDLHTIFSSLAATFERRRARQRTYDALRRRAEPAR